MIKKTRQQKVLARKVLCSLLAAGVMSVVLPMGSALAAEQTVSHGAVDQEGGLRVIYVGLPEAVSVSNDDTSGVTTVKSASLELDYKGTSGVGAIQARADKELQVYPVLNVLTEDSLMVSSVFTAATGQDGIVNLNSSNGDVVLSTSYTSSAALGQNETAAQHLSNNAYSTIYARNCFGAGEVNVSGKNVQILTAENTMTDSSMANVKYGTAISGNGSGEVNIHATDAVVIHGAIESLNTLMQGSGTTGIKINVNQDAADTAKVTMEGLFINAADQSEVNIKGAAGSSITADLLASAGQSEAGHGGKINIAFADGGRINGSLTAQNGGAIKVAGADIKGAIIVDGSDSKYQGTDTGVTVETDNLGTYSRGEKGAVIITNNGKAVFDGEKTEINVGADYSGKVYGVVLKDSKAEFNADTTIINVNNSNSVGTWDYAVDVKENSAVTFGGKDVNIKANKTDYTAQTFTVRGGSTADFNNQGATVISAESNASVTALDVKNGGVMNVNSDSFAINSEIAEGGEAAINAIGIQIHSESNQTETTKLNIGNAVKDFTINVKGQGYDYDGTSYSSGTAALKASDGAVADIKAENFTADVIFNNSSSSGDDNHNIMAGLWSETAGKIKASENTDTVINVTKTGPTAAKAYAVWSTGTESDISLLGNTSIGAYGREASYALYAEDGGQITVGSEGKTVSLTGDVVAENSGVVYAGRRYQCC